MAADPDIQARWDEARNAIRQILQPHVQDALLNDRVADITDWLNQNNWRPPLHRLNPLLAAGRAARDQAARQDP